MFSGPNFRNEGIISSKGCRFSNRVTVHNIRQHTIISSHLVTLLVIYLASSYQIRLLFRSDISPQKLFFSFLEFPDVRPNNAGEFSHTGTHLSCLRQLKPTRVSDDFKFILKSDSRARAYQGLALQRMRDKMRINMTMLPMKLHYFLFNAGGACMIPFLPVMAKGMGLSAKVVGIIYTFLPVMGMVTKPILGGLADKFKIQKVLCVVCISFSMIFLFAIPWIPPLPSEAVGAFHCGDADSYLKLTSPQLKDKCVQDSFNSYSANSTVKCQMHCMADAGMVEAICKYWGQPQFCAQQKHPNDYHFNMVTMKYISINGTVNSTASSTPAKVFSASPQVLDFEAILRAGKTELINETIFFRLGGVVFPHSNISVPPYCNNSLQEMNCDLTCDDVLINDLFLNPSVPDSEVPWLYQFWLFVLFIVLGWMGQAGGVSLGDAICFELLGDSPSKYGDQRLWGSVGWGTFSVIVGIAVDQFSQGTVKNYFPAIWIMFAVFFMNIVVVASMRYQQTKTSSSILRDVGKLFAELRILVFILWCTFVGMGTALIWNFLLWHLENLSSNYNCDMRVWIKTLEGLVMGIQCFGGELPFFFLSGRILKKLGHVNCMTLVLFAFGVRFILYSLLVNPWLCIPIEFLNGVTFGLFYATMASYASIVALPGTEATMQGLVGAVFEGVGVSLGSFIGGFMFDSFEGSFTFRVFGIAALVASVVHAIVQYFLSRRFSVIQFHERDFKQTRYANPQDAIHMLQDPHNSSLNVAT